MCEYWYEHTFDMKYWINKPHTKNSESDAVMLVLVAVWRYHELLIEANVSPLLCKQANENHYLLFDHLIFKAAVDAF